MLFEINPECWNLHFRDEQSLETIYCLHDEYEHDDRTNNNNIYTIILLNFVILYISMNTVRIVSTAHIVEIKFQKTCTHQDLIRLAV